MKGFLLIILVVISNVTTDKWLIDTDEITALFTKAFKDELAGEDYTTIAEVTEILRRPERVSRQQFGFGSPIRMTFDCLICRSAFGAFFSAVHDGHSDEQLVRIISFYCVILGIEDENVCHGAVALNIPVLRYIIEKQPAATPAAFCGLLLQTAEDPDVCPFSDPRFEWTVQLPEAPSIQFPPIIKTTGEPLNIAILTDAHIDPLYEAFGVADCSEPTCCRKGQKPASSVTYKAIDDESFVKRSLFYDGHRLMLNLSLATNVRQNRRMKSVVLNRDTSPAGYWGDYRNCDTPLWSYDELVDTITDSNENFDLVYYIGDSIDHGVWETTIDLINDMNSHVVNKISNSFGDVLAIPVIGNHESQPTNQFAPSSVTSPELNTTWLYDGLANKWSRYLPEAAKETFRERGDFSLLAKPGLRVISLNNNVAYKYNWWLVYDPLDAKKHLEWLIEELHKAELSGEKVHILAHIPPGVPDLSHTWTREYNRIVNRFSSTIVAEFNGHTHSDEFKIFYDEHGSPSAVSFGGGGATSYSNYNLNYKIATVNADTFEPENIRNFVYNLTEANLSPNRRPHWFQLYNFKNSFALDDLSPASMDNLVHRMVTEQTELLDLYSAFYSKLSDTRWPNCDTNCKLENLCKTVVTVLWNRERCNELVNQFYNLRRLN